MPPEKLFDYEVEYKYLSTFISLFEKARQDVREKCIHYITNILETLPNKVIIFSLVNDKYVANILYDEPVVKIKIDSDSLIHIHTISTSPNPNPDYTCKMLSAEELIEICKAIDIKYNSTNPNNWNGFHNPNE